MERADTGGEKSFLALLQGGNRTSYDAGFCWFWFSVHKQSAQQKQPGCYSALCEWFLLTIGEAAALCSEDCCVISMEVLTCNP